VVRIDYGREHLEVTVPENKLVRTHVPVQSPALLDPAQAMGRALEEPFGFPALRRALTPDDHIAVALDDHLPHLAELVTPLLEHVALASVPPEAVTLVCPAGSSSQEWVQSLPEPFQKVKIEIHDPTERKKLSYLATTRRGRRIYLNRTAVDADQLVVLSRRGYDPLLGYGGAEAGIYPALSDETTHKELAGRLSLAAPREKPWPVRQEALEVAWLLGAPFMLQVVEGAGDDIAHIVGGPAETEVEGVRLLNARWHVRVDDMADLVVAGIGGDPLRHRFAELAEAVACASRVVKPGGRIVLLTQSQPELGVEVELLRHAEDPGQAVTLIRRHAPRGMAAAFQWASAAQRAAIYVLAGLPPEIAEEMFAIPLEQAEQVQRLVNSATSCIFLTDAHKTMAVAP
jgi:nickel-dependent lactate racemase